MPQQQFSSFIQMVGIIYPCPDNAVRAVKGLRPLNDISTGEDAEDEDEFDEDEF